MAKNEGKKFEQDFIKSIPEEVFYIRLNDPAQSFSPTCRTCKNSGTRFSLKNPFDFVLFSSPNLICLELKSCKGKSLSFDREKVKGSSKNIKWHQIIGLMEAAVKQDVKAGFLINFRDLETTYYLPIDKFLLFMKDSDKGSMNVDDIVKYDGVRVFSQKKVSRFTYDVKDFINFIQGDYIL